VTDAWNPDDKLPQDLIDRLLNKAPLKEHLAGQHDQADHGKWAAEKAQSEQGTDAENAVSAGAKISRVFSSGDKGLKFRRYAATSSGTNEYGRLASRIGDIDRALYKDVKRIGTQLQPTITNLMAGTPFDGSADFWIENVEAKQLQGLLDSGLITKPEDVAAVQELQQIRATERATKAMLVVAQQAPEDQEGLFPNRENIQTHLIEDENGKAAGIVQYVIDQKEGTIRINELVELGVAPGVVTVAVGAAMKVAAENKLVVKMPRAYISGRAPGENNGRIDYSDKLEELGIPYVASGEKGVAYEVIQGDIQDWAMVAFESTPPSFGLPPSWKRDPSKPFDAPPTAFDTAAQHQAMVESAKASPLKEEKLSLEEVGTVQSWQSMDWRGINKAAAIMSENPVDGLTGSDLEGSDLEVVVQELDDIASRNTAKEDWTLWRGVSAPGLKGNPGADPRREAGMIEAIRGAGEGGIIESGKFVSMTTREDVAQSFADDRMLKINVPAATRGFWVDVLSAVNSSLPPFLSEKEFVAARGTKYRIDKIVEEHPDYGFYAELTVLP